MNRTTNRNRALLSGRNGLCAAGLLSFSVLALAGCAADVPPSSSGPGVIALFNPAATPPVVPQPTDLVRVGGKLQIPIDPAEATNPALSRFNNYLRGLDGFPPDSSATTTFSGSVEPSSLAGNVVVFDATAGQMLQPTEFVAALDAANDKKLLISTTSRYRNGHTYFVGILSWTDSGGVHGVKGSDGNAVIADSAFAFLRSPTPLYAQCKDATNPACLCTDYTSASCHSVVDGLSSAQALQFEAARLGIKPIIETVLSQLGRQPQELVLGFSFTISARSFAAFDPTRSQIPFPSNLLLSNRGIGDPKADATINLPILATDDARTQGLKMGLNTLDGFSTTGSVQFPIDSARVNNLPVGIDATTVVPGASAFLFNIAVPTQQPAFTAKPLQAILDPTNGTSGFAGQIWVTPTRPLLGERTTYASVVTNKILDDNGKALVPAPAMMLIVQDGPLFVDGKSAISTFSDAQAAQLETLRVAFQPLVTQLSGFGIDPATIAGITVYRTQSIVSPLSQLLGATAQLAAGGAIPTGVTITGTAMNPGAPFANLSAIVHGILSVRRVVGLRSPFDTTRLGAAVPNDTIPFMLTVPTAALTPVGGAPVIIAQHGLTRWRGDTLAIANTLASAGMAMIAIDAIYHGGRVVCLADTDCDTAITCSQPPPVNGQPQAGTCSGAYKPDPAATVLPGTAGTTDAKLPVSSLPNRDFTNVTNPFAQRDNFRQHVLDLTQLVRVIKATTAGTSLAARLAAAGLPALDNSKIGYLGQSLGAILGTEFLAMSSAVTLGVLNVGGGNLVEMFTDPGSSLSGGFAAALGVTPGTPAFYSLLENFRWIMDPAEPLNFARFVRAPDAVLMPTRTAAKVILQEAGLDTVILNKYTYLLGVELGLPVDTSQHLLGIDREGTVGANNKTTFFPTATHGVIFNPTDTSIAAVQGQATGYLFTGLTAAAPLVQ